MYEAFGLRIVSDFPLPELPIRCGGAYADLRIRRRELEGEWREKAPDPGRLVLSDGDAVWFRVPDTAVFRVSYGDEIVVSPLPGMDEDKARLYVLGTCMAILLLQRKLLPLHGSAIKIGGAAYAIVGDSGAGKSTLASLLLQEGHSLVSDDLIAVSFEPWSEREGPEIVPSYPQQKLWRDSLRLLDLEESGYRPLFERENKFAVPVPERFHAERLPFGGVFELTAGDGVRVEARPLAGLEAIRALRRHTFRSFFVGMLGLQAWHFDLSVRLAERVAMRRLSRPSAGYTAPQLAEAIYTEIQRRNRDAARDHASC